LAKVRALRPWKPIAAICIRCLPIASDAHLINAIAYVLRNPVAAALCDHPGEWSESSYRATVGRERAPRWLVVDQVLSFFGPSPESSRATFGQLVGSGHLPVSDTSFDEPPAAEHPPAGEHRRAA